MIELIPIADVLALLADISIMAILFTVLAQLALRVLRVESAALRHSVWLSVAVGMTLFPLLHAALPNFTIPLITVADADDVSLGVLDPAWYPSIVGVYVGIVCLLLVSVGVGFVISRRLAATSVALGDRVWVEFCVERFPGSILRRAPTVGVSRRVRVPMTIGFLRPRIILPVESTGWSAEKMRSVLAHEIAHVRRGDYLWQFVGTLNACFYWFHPIAWVLLKRMVLAAECACDDSAILTVGDNKEYARHLVDIASNLCDGRGRVLVSGLPMATAGQMNVRIDAILNTKRTLAHGGSVLRAAAVFAVALAMWGIAASLCWRYTEPRSEAPIAAAIGDCPMQYD
jgi:beta-lactamase regulating signal transducer with metallopeptidase domain